MPPTTPPGPAPPTREEPPHRGARGVATVTLLLFSLGSLAASATAQHNPVERRNAGVLWLEPTRNPVTGHPHPDRRQNPPSHATAGGVPAATRSYVWIPATTHDRGEDTPVDGFRVPIGPSSATAAYPASLYVPEVAVCRTRAVGGHVEPDPQARPWLVLAEAPTVFATFGFFETTRTLLNPVPLPAAQRELVVSLRWRGGDGRDLPDTLQMWGDAAGASAQWPQPLFGFVDPGGAVTPVSMLGVPDPGHLNATYLRATPALAARGDWAQAPAGFPPTAGTHVAVFEAPLATGSGTLAFEVAYGPRHAGQFAVALCNVGPLHGTPTGLLGQVFELDLLDPALAALANAGYLLQLDTAGHALGPTFPVPPFGAGALGSYLGVELAVLAPSGGSLEATTAAGWLRIAR